MSTLDFKAIYLDGVTPVKKNAYVKIIPGALAISLESGPEQKTPLDHWLLSSIEIEVIRDHEIYVFSDPSRTQRIEVVDPAAISALLKIKKVNYFDYYSGIGLKIVAFLGLVIVMAVLFWKLSPKISSHLSKRIPIDVELKLRPYLSAQIGKLRCQSPEADKALTKILDFLQHGDAEPFPAEISLGNQKAVNAFAYPGGTILVTQGLVGKAKSQEALIGIIAHELQHLKERHIAAAIIRGSLLTLIWSVALGDFSGVFVVDPSTLYQIASLQFSRNDEAEADLKGAEMLAKKGIAVLPMINFLEVDLTNGKKMDHLEFLSSHPLKNRGAILRKHFAMIKTIQLPLSEEEWIHLKKDSCITPPEEKTKK